jgi:RNA-binding protein
MTQPTPPTKQERRQLASAAHHLKAELFVGRDGFSEACRQSLYEAFHTKELLKVKLLDTSDEDRASLRGKFEALPDIFLIQNIGRTFILFKRREEQAASGQVST